jgi:hypothetical protein
MPDKLIGVTVSASEVHVVLLTKNGTNDFTLDDQTTMNVQKGDRPEAYNTLHGQFSDYVRQHRVKSVCIKGSAVSLGGTTLAHLQAAELRGVVEAAAAAAGAEVRLMTKATASRNFGTRKVDEYLKDDTYWQDIDLQDLKKKMREAAFAAIYGFSV